MIIRCLFFLVFFIKFQTLALASDFVSTTLAGSSGESKAPNSVFTTRLKLNSTSDDFRPAAEDPNEKLQVNLSDFELNSTIDPSSDHHMALAISMGLHSLSSESQSESEIGTFRFKFEGFVQNILAYRIGMSYFRSPRLGLLDEHNEIEGALAFHQNFSLAEGMNMGLEISGHGFLPQGQNNNAIVKYAPGWAAGAKLFLNSNVGSMPLLMMSDVFLRRHSDYKLNGVSQGGSALAAYRLSLEGLLLDGLDLKLGFSYENTIFKSEDRKVAMGDLFIPGLFDQGFMLYLKLSF